MVCCNYSICLCQCAKRSAARWHRQVPRHLVFAGGSPFLLLIRMDIGFWLFQCPTFPGSLLRGSHSITVTIHLQNVDMVGQAIKQRTSQALGYLPFRQAGGALLCHLISKLYERTSLVITTNLNLAEWASVFGNPVHGIYRKEVALSTRK